jgi:hypothetical protein
MKEPKTFEFMTVSNADDSKSPATQKQIKKHVVIRVRLSYRRQKMNGTLCNTVIDPSELPVCLLSNWDAARGGSEPSCASNILLCTALIRRGN